MFDNWHTDLNIMYGLTISMHLMDLFVQTSAEYFYVDVWSSPFTWGGGPLPKDGDFVVISKGQNILLDVDSPKLKIILIRGMFFLYQILLCFDLKLIYYNVNFFEQKIVNGYLMG